MKSLVFLIALSLMFQGLIAAETPKLTVTGTAVLSKPADQLNLTVGVITQDSTVEVALKANKERMARVLDALKAVGLQEQEYYTGGFTIAPQYTPPPHNPPPDWSPVLKGYEVRNTLTIKTEKIQLIGQLIDAVGKVGVNLIKDIAFALHDTENAEKEAIAQAIRQAHMYAEAAAKEAHISLGSIQEVSINPSSIQPRYLNFSRFATAASESATPILPGDVDVTASVSLVYEIKV